MLPPGSIVRLMQAWSRGLLHAMFEAVGAAPVVWWRLNGAGHPPASQRVAVATTPLTGAHNRDIEFAEVAWAFFAARL